MLLSIAEKYMSLTPGRGVVVFDPMTMTAISLGATAVGAGVTAAGTIAGGNAAQASAGYQAAQLRENQGAAIASSQQQMLDTQQKTRLAMSKVAADSGANGTNAGVGSPAATTSGIAQRGSYLAAMDLFRGQNQATGLDNQAKGALFTGDAAKQGSDYSALGTIAGAGGQMASQYGRYKYPAIFGFGQR